MKELTISLPETVDEKVIKMLIAASLYENDVLSSEQSAEIVGITRREFLEEVGKYQVSIFGEKAEDLDDLEGLAV